MSMFPSSEMRAKLAYMHQRGPDGTLRPCKHLMRRPLVVDPDDKVELNIFNSGGVGMSAKPRDYCSKFKRIFALQPSDSDALCTEFPNYSRQGIQAARPDLTNPVPELYPVAGDPPQGWGLTFMLSNGGAPERAKGTVHWAGCRISGGGLIVIGLSLEWFAHRFYLLAT
ncbi:beta-lactamase [Fusarium beomiforme]|uniref:Beta-lactamase n=1 Tax=Fusarium beomiforme TaxID=44412 RepID=A0A9P5AQ27_9HYPO|nr:beta-lactamase [Fusarium beomiforme]